MWFYHLLILMSVTAPTLVHVQPFETRGFCEATRETVQLRGVDRHSSTACFQVPTAETTEARWRFTLTLLDSSPKAAAIRIGGFQTTQVCEEIRGGTLILAANEGTKTPCRVEPR